MKEPRAAAHGETDREEKLILDPAGLFSFSTLYCPSLLIFLGLSVFPSHGPDFTCGSAERKGTEQGATPGQISGEETSLYAEGRASLRASAVRLCAVGTQEGAGLR